MARMASQRGDIDSWASANMDATSRLTSAREALAAFAGTEAGGNEDPQEIRAVLEAARQAVDEAGRQALATVSAEEFTDPQPGAVPDDVFSRMGRMLALCEESREESFAAAGVLEACLESCSLHYRQALEEPPRDDEAEGVSVSMAAGSDDDGDVEEERHVPSISLSAAQEMEGILEAGEALFRQLNAHRRLLETVKATLAAELELLVLYHAAAAEEDAWPEESGALGETITAYREGLLIFGETSKRRIAARQALEAIGDPGADKNELDDADAAEKESPEKARSGRR